MSEKTERGQRAVATLERAAREIHERQPRLHGYVVEGSSYDAQYIRDALERDCVSFDQATTNIVRLAKSFYRGGGQLYRLAVLSAIEEDMGTALGELCDMLVAYFGMTGLQQKGKDEDDKDDPILPELAVNIHAPAAEEVGKCRAALLEFEAALTQLAACVR